MKLVTFVAISRLPTTKILPSRVLKANMSWTRSDCATNVFKWQNVESWLLNSELKDALFLSTETENVSFLCKCTSVDGKMFLSLLKPRSRAFRCCFSLRLFQWNQLSRMNCSLVKIKFPRILFVRWKWGACGSDGRGWVKFNFSSDSPNKLRKSGKYFAGNSMVWQIIDRAVNKRHNHPIKLWFHDLKKILRIIEPQPVLSTFLYYRKYFIFPALNSLQTPACFYYLCHFLDIIAVQALKSPKKSTPLLSIPKQLRIQCNSFRTKRWTLGVGFECGGAADEWSFYMGNNRWSLTPAVVHSTWTHN